MDDSDGHLVEVEVQSGLGAFRARFRASSSPSSPGVLGCLGLRYASVPRRWAAPRPAPSPWPGVQDLTAFGPACPQVREPLFAVPGLPVFGPPSAASVSVLADAEDEFRCLNLNVFAPVRLGGGQTTLQLPAKPLPVLVWVHGGAFRAGAGGVALYDGSPLVARALAIGQPVIVVTLNYRLGVLGFIYSQKLLADAATQTDVPEHGRSTANLALLDIGMAMQWVKRHIGQFGGDPANITAFGESAGSALLNYLALVPALHPKIPRMLYASSSVFSVQLLQGDEGEAWVDAICEKNGILPGAADVVERLRRVDAATLVQSSHFACASFRPVLDGVTIPHDPRTQHFDQGLAWDASLREVVFGHCENEAWIKLACRRGVPPPLAANLAGRIPPVDALRRRALRLYREETDADYAAWYQSPTPSQLAPGALAWMALDGHARYYVPGRLLARSFGAAANGSAPATAVYRYIFSWAPTQWPANWPATHTADLLPLFLHRSLGAQDTAAARRFADQVVLFAAGATGQLALQRYGEATGWASNVFQRDGTWAARRQDEGEFGLTEEAVALWEDVYRSYLDWDAAGWAGVIR